MHTTETTLKETTLPELRQMVLENTRRINNNEMSIDEIREAVAEQSKSGLEHYEIWENFLKEHKLSMNDFESKMQVSDARMDRLEHLFEVSRIENDKRAQQIFEMFAESERLFREGRAETERFSKELRAETEKRFLEERAETERLFREGRAETERFSKELRAETEEIMRKSRAETEKFIKERHAETERILQESAKKTDEQIRRISVEFLGSTGHIVEGLASSAVDHIFKNAGLDLLHYGKNIRPKLPAVNNKVEVDVLLGNGQYTVPVEVNADFTKKKVRRFIRQMERFRWYFPEYADTEILGAVAAINYEYDAAQFAHDEGLLVIRVSSDDIFSLDPFEEIKLRRF